MLVMRPNLTKEISIHEFKDFYWLKEELQNFCRENGMSASGSKLEISDRIETFLHDRRDKKASEKIKSKQEGRTTVELSLDTVITENHRCSQDVRAFFKISHPQISFFYLYSKLL